MSEREGQIADWWGLVGPEVHRRLAFCRLKTFLVAPEAAALAWLLSTVRGGKPLLGLEHSAWYLAPFVILMLLGGLIECFYLFRRLLSLVSLRPHTAYLPTGRYLMASQFALICGLLAGSSLAGHQTARVGLVLMAGGIVASVFAVLVFGLSALLLALPGRQVAAPLAWGLLCFVFFVAGAVLHHQPETGQPLLRLLSLFLALTPVASVVLGLSLGKWWLAPHRWSELRSGAQPSPDRNALRLVAAIALLPLGGLMILLGLTLVAHHSTPLGPAPESRS